MQTTANNVEKLVGEHMIYAEKLARKFKKKLPSFVDFDDILSSAYVGLVESANKYKESDGSFTTYAFKRINGSMQDFLRKEYFPETSDEIEARPVYQSKLYDLIDFLEQNIGKKQTDMVSMYVLGNYSLEEVARKHKLSSVRICQIISEVKSRMQDKYRYFELAA